LLVEYGTVSDRKKNEKQFNILYAFYLGKPGADIVIKSLFGASKFSINAITSVALVSSKEKIYWNQTDQTLVIKNPVNLQSWQVVASYN